MHSPIDIKHRQAVVIGGGIAGVAIIRALKRVGLNHFLVIESKEAMGLARYLVCEWWLGRFAANLFR